MTLKLDSFWLYSRGEVLMEQDVRVAGGTVDIETGQLLNKSAVCVLLYSVITKMT